MIDTQIGRRNLEPIQRVQIAEKYRPTFEKKAKENLKIPTGGRNSLTLQNSAESKRHIDTRDELAKLAGVSHDTYNK